MASPRFLRTRPVSILFVVVVILSLGATGTLADLPATHLFQSELPPPPPNDNFDGAMEIGSLPFSDTQNTEGATVEAGEPVPSCRPYWEYSPDRTIWYQYTPGEDGSVLAQPSGSFSVITAVYTGSDLGSPSEVACRYFSDRVFMAVQQGVTYYFQVGNVYPGEFGVVNFLLEEPPLPTADFYWYPSDPSRYDDVQFCSNAYDPVWAGWSGFWWDFGEGAVQADYSCESHRFGADGDYSVWHKVQTTDGREAEVTKTVEVRTHDVAITKFAVPKSASAGQTRQITVGLRNYAYPEEVQVELYKSGPNGYEWIGTARQEVAVRSGNRTTDFKFSYTFTSNDASLGKITFRAVATIHGPHHDALPADNEAISSPCKVSGK